MTDTSPDELAEQGSSDSWSRLSPVSVIYFVLRFIVGFARHGIQNVAIFGGIVFAAGDKRLGIILFALAAGLVALIVASLLSYMNFRFRVNQNAFLIHKGVLQKSRLTLSFDRIQNIAIKQPVYFRPFGLVTMALESAGSASEEVNLAGIDRDLAERLRTTVLARPKDTATPIADETDSIEVRAGDELLHHGTGELARYGLSNNNVWVFAGLAAGALSQLGDELGDRIDDWLKMPENYFTSLDTSMAVVAGAGLLVFVLCLLLAGSVIGAIVIYHDYRLAFADDRFLRTKGLFERSETSLPARKVQALELRQPWPALLLKRTHATLLQIGFKNPWEDGNLNPKQTKFIIPSLTDANVGKLVTILYPGLHWQGMKLEGVDGLYLKRLFFIDFFFPLLLVSALLSSFTTPWFLLLNLVAFLLFPLMQLHYRRQGYWTDGGYIAVRTGIIGHKLVIFPIHKAQSVVITRSPGQRRHALASLTIKLAGHKVKIPYVPHSAAQALRDHILQTVFTNKTPWM